MREMSNTEQLVQVKIRVTPEIAAAFKARCRAAGVSVSGEISRFMDAAGACAKSGASPVATRRQRRKAVETLITQIEAVMGAEQQYIDNIPDNLRGSCYHEAAGETVANLEEALCILREAYG